MEVCDEVEMRVVVVEAVVDADDEVCGATIDMVVDGNGEV